MSNAPHQDLRQNLDAFIRKYHRNEILRGLLMCDSASHWLASKPKLCACLGP